jgi:small subunit ribosomal protein S1
MTESKGKSTKAEKVEKNETAEKPAKKPRTKTTASKKAKEAGEIKKLPSEENVSVVTEVAVAETTDIEKAKEAIAEDVKSEAATEAHPEKKEKKIKKSEAEVVAEVKAEAETETEVAATVESEIKTERKGTLSNEDFDWEAFESEELRTSPRFTEYENLYDKTLSTVAVDEVVPGTVIQMTTREVVINIGYKSEGVVSLNEFR